MDDIIWFITTSMSDNTKHTISMQVYSSSSLIDPLRFAVIFTWIVRLGHTNQVLPRAIYQFKNHTQTT